MIIKMLIELSELGHKMKEERNIQPEKNEKIIQKNEERLRNL